MSQMPRRGLPHAFTHSIPALGACAMLLTLTGCTELARFIGKADSKPAEPVVAEQTTSQQTEERVEGPVEKPKPSKLYEWNGDGRKVSRIVIDTDKQRASFFVGEDEIGWSTVASGLPKHPTPTGKFAVMEKVENKRSNLYGKVVKNGKVVRSNAKAGRDPIPAGARFEGAHMPYFMRLTYDGIGLHAGPIPRPGQPASHGCIRLPSTLAPVLFKHVSHGTEVTIVGSGPSYGNYVEKQRIAAERAKREAEKQRIAQANAAAASPSADSSPAVASTPSSTATSRPAQQAATQPTEPPTASSTEMPATDPANALPVSAPASVPESSTAAAAPRNASPTSGATATEVTPTTSVTTAPAAPMDSPENAPRTVAEPAAAPEQADPQPRPAAAPPETATTTIAETAASAGDANPPARPSPPAPTPAAPASDPAPAPEAPQSSPSTGSEASQAPAPAAPPAPPATPPTQAQQVPAAAAQGDDG